MKALTIAYVALLRLFRDRSNLFFVFVLPIGIIIIIGAQFGGGFNPKIGVVVEDGAGQLGEDLAVSIEAREDVDVIRYDDSDGVVNAVERGDVQAAAVIPAGYDDTLRTGGTAEVGFYARPDAAVYQTIVFAEVADQSSIVRAARFAEGQTGVPFDAAFATATMAATAKSGR